MSGEREIKYFQINDSESLFIKRPDDIVYVSSTKIEFISERDFRTGKYAEALKKALKDAEIVKCKDGVIVIARCPSTHHLYVIRPFGKVGEAGQQGLVMDKESILERIQSALVAIPFAGAQLLADAAVGDVVKIFRELHNRDLSRERMHKR